MILDDLDAFLQEHRRRGELESGIEETPEFGSVAWMGCSCGGHMAKLVTQTQDKAAGAGDFS